MLFDIFGRFPRNSITLLYFYLNLQLTSKHVCMCDLFFSLLSCTNVFGCSFDNPASKKQLASASPSALLTQLPLNFEVNKHRMFVICQCKQERDWNQDGIKILEDEEV
jgi:hypothetical protein